MPSDPLLRRILTRKTRVAATRLNKQWIERAIPGVELAMMHAHAATLMPVRCEAPAAPIADKIGVEPAGQAVFAGGSDEPVGDEHEGAIGEGDLGARGRHVFVEDGPQAELLEERADDEDGSPGGSVEDVDGVGILVGERACRAGRAGVEEASG
jgi:hypothetical protein